MNPFYQSQADRPPAVPVRLPEAFSAREEHPAHYLADEGLTHAVNTALLLGRPLLVTGEPGTGKTQLAASVAFQLGFGEPLSFVAKSTSLAQELFYSFDALGRLRGPTPPSVAQSDGLQTAPGYSETSEFLRYNALGKAILYANPEAAVRALMPRAMPHPGQRRSVVLVDEIDKAPRDFPNDMLSEIERMEFWIAELDSTLRADRSMRPVIIITSNSERGLPDAFLRRCIYYDIPFPDLARLDQILMARLASFYDPQFAASALELLALLREERVRLNKRPSTAELIGFMLALVRSQSAAGSKNPLADRARALEHLSALVKTRDDLRQARPVVDAWARQHK